MISPAYYLFLHLPSYLIGRSILVTYRGDTDLAVCVIHIKLQLLVVEAAQIIFKQREDFNGF